MLCSPGDVLKVCLSQFRSGARVETNVARHVEVAHRAASVGSRLVLFPELSLTGYAPSRARGLALALESPHLRPLSEASAALDVTLACGAPLHADAGGVEIGMVVFSPGQAPVRYAKQRLHADEEPFFVGGTQDLMIRVDGHAIAPGICFESMQPSHVAAGVQRGASVYAASVAKPGSSMDAAHRHYSAMAREHGLPILLVNAVGTNEEFVCGGRSAAWDSQGALLASLDGGHPGELWVDV